ncbi:hypothetical protein JCM14036_24410 [Desulfotomaculum defluvii]
MKSQQLVNGHMLITTIAKYSIAETHSIHVSNIEAFVDAYNQDIYLSTEKTMDFTPLFDHYGQQIMS